MAYADQQGMSSARIISIAAVLILHAFLGYALVTGLAYEAVKNVAERLEVVDVQEEKPPEEEPPPPPPEDVFVAPPPVFVAPKAAPSNNTTTTTTTDTSKKEETPKYVQCPAGSQQSQVLEGQQCVKKAADTKKCWDGSVVEVTASCPPEPKDQSRPATPKNNRNTWVTTNDYPSRSLSREEEGTSRINLTVGPDGRVTGCSASGATAALDAAACQFASRRARFNPALDKAGNPTTGQFSTSVRWVIPK